MDVPDALAVLPQLLSAQLRCDAGEISMLEAAIEQLEALLTVSPHPIGPKLVAALKAFNDGNDVPLNQLMFGTDHYPFPKENHMPGLLDKAVSRIASRGVPTKSAWPIAVSAMQKAGNLQKGSVKPTKQGVQRNKMTRAQRQENPPSR
jgi:hypothetical protein